MVRDGRVTFILGAGAGLGVLGDLLLRPTPWGLNFTIWIVLLVTCAGRITGISPVHSGLALPIAFYAGSVAWRDSSFLRTWNVLAVLTLLALPVIQHRGVALRTGKIGDYAQGALATVEGVLLGAFKDLAGSRAGTVSRRGWFAGLVGLALAAPIALVFGALFASADPAFDRAVGSLLSIDLASPTRHLSFAALFGAMAAGYLSRFLERDPVRIDRPSRCLGGNMGLIEVGIPLTVMIVLFTVFLAFQVEYLFGGADVVRTITGLTHAEYARRGFFELTAAAALVVPVLLIGQWLLNDRPTANRVAFRTMATVQIGLVFILMVSAIHRMLLYRAAYGLTADRLYATTFLIFIGTGLVWFAATALRGARDRFAFGVLVSGLMTLAALNFMNPDGVVAKTNIARVTSGRPFDVSYLGTSSSDAVPAILGGLDFLHPDDRCQLATILLQKWQGEQSGWRQWNLSRWRAGRLVRARTSSLTDSACETRNGR